MTPEFFPRSCSSMVIWKAQVVRGSNPYYSHGKGKLPSSNLGFHSYCCKNAYASLDLYVPSPKIIWLFLVQVNVSRNYVVWGSLTLKSKWAEFPTPGIKMNVIIFKRVKMGIKMNKAWKHEMDADKLCFCFIVPVNKVSCAFGFHLPQEWVAMG